MIRSVRTVGLSSLVALAAVACGSGERSAGFGDPAVNSSDPTDPAATDGIGGGGFSPAGTTLTIDPPNATITIDTATNPATPATVAYTVRKNVNGVDTDVTGSATFTVDDAALGAFAGSTFTSVAKLPGDSVGVTTMVHVTVNGEQSVVPLTILQLRKTGAARDFYFIEPYEKAPSPASDVLLFSTKIQQVDVAFVMDTTGSMTGSINNLKTALQGTLLGQLQAAIPNVGLAVVDHRDFGDAWVANVRQVVTTNLALAQSAVGAMSAGGGGDTPEAQIAAMQFALTGQANSPIAAHTPAAGTFGGVDFRAGAVPVVVEITDAPWHDGSGNATLSSLEAAFTANHAKFVDITNSSGGPEDQANTLSDATGSHLMPSAFAGCAANMCCTGVSGAARAPTGPGGSCRLNFLHNNGAGVSTGIVNAIEAIAVGSEYNVTAVPSNDPANAGGVDATKFIKALRAKDEGDAASGCPAHAATDTDGDGVKDTFTAVTVGTPVCFEVIPQMNTTVTPTTQAQFFNAFIDVLGVPGNVKLDKRTVLFLVPPKDPNVK